ncbi:MAG TPA: 4-hydroxy-tetrahydrodipicolinate reductase [Haliangiales bacterium]|nr:4-hydroxy-tetrahydrodipicolinate reductase [Haliangiales bacterium]
MIRAVVPGAAGKMGGMLIQAIRSDAAVALHAAVERKGHAAVGTEAEPGVTIGDDFARALHGADVYIDFTAPEATGTLVAQAAARRVAAVIGTTGLSPEARTAIFHAAADIPVVVAPNFSLGVNLLLGLAEEAARALGPEYDVEVVEIHHRHKRDAPSGTAIALAEALARGRDADLAQVKRFSREGDVGARADGEIGVQAVRGGDVVGEHTVLFLGPAERIELAHRAGSRLIFARGAVRAAAWVAGKPAGVYSMKDVLGL